MLSILKKKKTINNYYVSKYQCKVVIINAYILLDIDFIIASLNNRPTEVKK